MTYSGENIKYKNNFLSSVICRIDFNSPLPEETINDLSKDTDLTGAFPIRGKDQVRKEKRLNWVSSFDNKKPEKPSVVEEEFTFIIKEFRNATGENKFVFAPTFIVFEYKKYNSFEKLKSNFLSVVNCLNKGNKDEKNTNISRFGLRYINIIDPDKIRILKGYFANTINAFVNFELAKGLSLSRAVGQVEYLQDDIRLVVHYGEYNRSYPGILLKHDFVLDYDASVQGLYSISDIFPNKLIAAHSMIQNVFEHSITDKFRKIMKE